MSTPSDRCFTVLVCGSGTVAHATAISYAQRGINTAIMAYDAPKPPEEQYDERIFAITPPHIRFLQRLGFWQRLPVHRLSDIDEMMIYPNADQSVYSDSSHQSTRLHLTALSAGVDCLATLVEHRQLLKIGDTMINEMVANDQITRLSPKALIHVSQDKHQVTLTFEDDSTLSTNLLIAADGAQSQLRQWLSVPVTIDDYGDSCIVGNFKTEKPHRQVAKQWFYPEGAIACLPIQQQQISLAWSCRHAKAIALSKNLSRLVQAMQASTQNHLGAFTASSPIQTWPLRRLYTSNMIQGRVILVGDSAHVVHPILGLGLNLGLGDVMTLLQLFGTIPAIFRMDLWQTTHYKLKRRFKVGSIQWLTHNLHNAHLRHRFFAPKFSVFGMKFVQNTAPLKEFLIHQITY